MIVEVSANNIDLEEIICYPKHLSSPSIFRQRIRELLKLGVRKVFLSGRTQIGRFRVLGKGCTSIVVLAIYKNRLHTLKIRRLDANRPNMVKEAENLKLVNALNIGPTLINFSENYILLEFINGLEILQWSKICTSPNIFKKVLSSLLKQCFILDRHGIYHAELSNLKDHVIICSKTNRPVIIDFETVSLNSKRKTLPAVVQNFVLKNWFLRSKYEEMVGRANKSLLIEKLREYKKDPLSTFAELYRLLLHPDT
ncbi:MAG: hypothetical protein DRN04_10035 [Thermoprotei archaeon]|nr:MAG: hypothetical protein DRN04_10035 [Thermoprotei archaeon]